MLLKTFFLPFLFLCFPNLHLQSFDLVRFYALNATHARARVCVNRNCYACKTLLVALMFEVEIKSSLGFLLFG